MSDCGKGIQTSVQPDPSFVPIPPVGSQQTPSISLSSHPPTSEASWPIGRSDRVVLVVSLTCSIDRVEKVKECLCTVVSIAPFQSGSPAWHLLLPQAHHDVGRPCLTRRNCCPGTVLRTWHGSPFFPLHRTCHSIGLFGESLYESVFSSNVVCNANRASSN